MAFAVKTAVRVNQMVCMLFAIGASVFDWSLSHSLVVSSSRVRRVDPHRDPRGAGRVTPFRGPSRARAKFAAASLGIASFDPRPHRRTG
jgi:hypothetical protein